MNVAGIVCEYNPFHNGHLYHISRTRELCAGEDGRAAVVGIMSGSVQQRGEFSLLDKYARAQAAVRGDGESPGADLIFELPAAFSCSSAERFAYAAVSALISSGVVTHLSFGSECGDAELLSRVCGCFGDARFSGLLKDGLSLGLSFPAARERAARELIGDEALVLSSPNDILGVEYLKALRRLKSDVVPVAVPRRAAGHHGTRASYGMASAGHIRRLVLSGRLEDAERLMPGPSYKALTEAVRSGRAPADGGALGLAMLAALKRMKPGDFDRLPDADGGLSRRLYGALRESAGFEEAVERAATRRYPRARIRRMLMCAFLGITAEMPDSPVPYLRALAFNDTGRALLRQIRAAGNLPVLVKPAHVKTLDGAARSCFDREALACDLFSLFTPARKECPGGRDFRRTPAYVQSIVE